MPPNPSPRNPHHPARATTSSSTSPTNHADPSPNPTPITTSSSSPSNSYSSPPPPPPPTPHPTPLESHLIHLTTDLVTACNNRFWNPSSYPWNTLDQKNFTLGKTYSTLSSDLNFSEFLENFQKLYASLPEYFIRIREIHASVNEKTGKAVVFLNMENVNFSPGGVLRYSVGKVEFEGRGEGRWVCVRYSSLPIGEGVEGG